MARNDGINRSSTRNQCVSKAGIGWIEGHNEREKATYPPDLPWKNEPADNKPLLLSAQLSRLLPEKALIV